MTEGIPIYVGDVELRSDADVALLEGYEVIQGSVALLEGVSDLSKLYALEEITGSLRIEDTTTLASLAGLENVRIIGVDLGIRGRASPVSMGSTRLSPSKDSRSKTPSFSKTSPRCRGSRVSVETS